MQSPAEARDWINRASILYVSAGVYTVATSFPGSLLCVQEGAWERGCTVAKVVVSFPDCLSSACITSSIKAIRAGVG